MKLKLVVQLSAAGQNWTKKKQKNLCCTRSPSCPPPPGSQWDNLLRTESHRDNTTVGTSSSAGSHSSKTVILCQSVKSLLLMKTFQNMARCLVFCLVNLRQHRLLFGICCPTNYFSVSAAARGEGRGDGTVTQYHCHTLKISNLGRRTMRSCLSLSSSCSRPSVSYQQVV